MRPLFWGILTRLELQANAYKFLWVGSQSLLESTALFPTEKLLLKAVRFLSGRRQQQLGLALSKLPPTPKDEANLKVNMLEAQVSAAMQGHDLGSWERVEEPPAGWEAKCRKCEMGVFVNEKTMYSLLEEDCPG